MAGKKGPTRTRTDGERVVFEGITFVRYSGGKYFETNRWDKVKKKYVNDNLHRAIWRSAHGEIPEYHDIHHIDENYNNNDISNLQCINRSEHARLHDRFRDFNGTPEALEHHKRIGRLSWEKRPYKTYQCVECGKDIISKAPTPSKYCSKECLAVFKKKNPNPSKPKPSIVTRNCDCCGKLIEDPSRRKRCSDECAEKMKLKLRSEFYHSWKAKQPKKERQRSVAVFPPKVCQLCQREYIPTGPQQRRCNLPDCCVSDNK